MAATFKSKILSEGTLALESCFLKTLGLAFDDGGSVMRNFGDPSYFLNRYAGLASCTYGLGATKGGS